VAIPDLDGEVLGHFPGIEDRADRHADLGGAAQGRVLALDLRLYAGKVALGRRQQLLTLARAFGRQLAIAANDQPFPREHLGRADLGKVPLVEQRQLQRPVLRRQRLDRRRA
jgi:hypothetical protein